MTLVEILLVVIALILAVGLSLLVLVAYDVRENQNRGAAALLQYLASHLGEPGDNELAYCSRDLRSFLDSVRRGLIPHLRRDDWYPTEEDQRRWQHAEYMHAAHQGSEARDQCTGGSTRGT